MLGTNGDFSHGPQHVFWTRLDQIARSRDMSSKKILIFWQVKMKMDGLLRTKIKFIKYIYIYIYYQIPNTLDVYV